MLGAFVVKLDGQYMQQFAQTINAHPPDQGFQMNAGDVSFTGFSEVGAVGGPGTTPQALAANIGQRRGISQCALECVAGLFLRLFLLGQSLGLLGSRSTSDGLPGRQQRHERGRSNVCRGECLTAGRSQSNPQKHEEVACYTQADTARRVLIGARYTAYRHPEVNVTTIVLALLAFVVIVSFVPSQMASALGTTSDPFIAGWLLVLAACTNPPPSCHGPLVQMNPGEWQATPADLGMAP